MVFETLFSATPHSFRHRLLARILLLILPMLCIGEGLVYQQARRSLLANAQIQAYEMAIAHAAILERRQLELLLLEPAANSATESKSCKGSDRPCEAAPLSRLERSWNSLQEQQEFETVAPTAYWNSSNHASAQPVIILLDAQGKSLHLTQLSHASSGSDISDPIVNPMQPASEHCQTNQAPPHCELSKALAKLEPGQTAEQLPRSLASHWLVASSPVRSISLLPADNAVSTTATPATAIAHSKFLSPLSTTAAGQLVVAIPSSQALAPLNQRLPWILGGTVLLTGVLGAIALYISRELAHPTELLRDRLLVIQQQLRSTELDKLQSLPPKPTLAIREFQQLDEAFEQLIDYLNQRTTDLEKATQDAHTASQLKSDFLAATSHELRTPLNALIGHIHLIQDGYCDSPEETAVCIQQADQAALHLLKVLNELLDIARIEAGNFELKTHSFELSQLINEVLDLERSHLIQKGLVLQFEPLDSRLQVEADRDKLKQVLLNVVSNAIKFTDRGSITISGTAIRTTLESSTQSPLATTNGLNLQDNTINEPPKVSPPQFALRITDSGIGIDPRQQKQLFRPFTRVNNSKTQYEGSGLGLAISRTLMEHMGGKINLISRGLGQGTTVEIILPLQQCPQPNDSRHDSKEQRAREAQLATPSA